MSTTAFYLLVLALTVMAAGTSLEADAEDFNYDESKVPAYKLPDSLVMQDGTPVQDAETWTTQRRPELLELFREHVYGRLPGRPEGMHFEVAEEDSQMLGGKATRKKIVIHFSDQPDGPKLTAVSYLPNKRSGPVPMFVGLRLFDRNLEYPAAGRHVTSRDAETKKNVVPTGFEKLPGEKVIETILDQGYGITSLDPADFVPDDKETWDESLIQWFEPEKEKRAPDMGKAIASWAWALSRTLDYFETDKDVDAKRVIVVGHSRMGKTALWAGAQDERFAIVISNNSGCGGAALSRRIFGETVARINTVFPFWFCDNFRRYNGRESDLPVDQHELVALVAPRPVYIASAEEDGWADPQGEFLSAVGADPVYQLLGVEGLGTATLPRVNQPIGGHIGYHLRVGQHALADYDWLRYLDFADRHLSK
ncbi:MAG: acetylxylan esterase [Pirellulales bacterium]|nr:acetylxylan esterase [Pirellulales bacterium]